ncbi:unnamed protein product, partial [Nesidiocoris tenuis]
MKLLVVLCLTALVAAAYADDDRSDVSREVKDWISNQAGKARESAQELRRKLIAKLEEEREQIKRGLKILKERL